MRSKALFLMSLLACASLAPALAAGALRAPPPGVSLSQIVEKHVAARGGVKAWHAVQTLAVSGKLDAGTGDSVTRSITMARQGAGASARRAERAAAQAATKETAERQVQLPFRLEMKRPSKSRLEIDFAGKTAVQVYDGQQGGKMRPYLNRDDVEPFTAGGGQAEGGQSRLQPPPGGYRGQGTPG